MSAPVGGQRLMFVSKEGAELVRRAMLLSRYDEVLEARRAGGDEGATSAAPSLSTAGDGGDGAADRGVAGHPLLALSQLPALLHNGAQSLLGDWVHNQTGDSGQGEGAGGGASLRPRLPSAAAGLPERLIDALAVASRGLGQLFDLRQRGAGAGGLPGPEVVDIPGGPVPQLPAPPLTRAMRLPEELSGGGASGVGAGEGSPAERTRDPDGKRSSLLAGKAGLDDEALLAELRRLEEDRVVQDAEALLRAGGKDAGSGGGSGGFLPPFSFSSYVARLPLEAALKAVLRGLPAPGGAPATLAPSDAAASCASTTAAAASSSAPADNTLASQTAAGGPAPRGAGQGPAANVEKGGSAGDSAAADAAAGSSGAAGPPRRRRFLLVPDAADEQAVEGSREVDRLVAELAASAAATEADPDAEAAAAGQSEGKADMATTATAATSAPLSAPGPRPRVALNVHDSDSRHWVLDVVDRLESDSGEADAPEQQKEQQQGSQSALRSSSLPTPAAALRLRSQAAAAGSAPAQRGQGRPHAASERLICGASSGPTDDLGGLVPSSSATGSPSTHGKQSADPDATETSDPECTSGNRSAAAPSGAGRTPLFLLPGVTLSVRSADGTLLRLRPAFLSLQQLAAAASLMRDVAVAGWRRQRSAARWKLVSALDVLTVHSAGFPIMRLPQQSQSPGGGGAAGGGNGNGGGDEDSDDGIPEAKDLLREMGINNRRPAAGALTGASPAPLPSGPMAVLSTVAVGVLSFGAWCLAAGADAWDAIYTRTPWGLEDIGIPEHINVRPTYLEDHVQQLAEANSTAVAAAAARVSAAAAQRSAEKLQRRKAAAARLARAKTQQEEEQQQPGNPECSLQGPANGHGAAEVPPSEPAMESAAVSCGGAPGSPEAALGAGRTEAAGTQESAATSPAAAAASAPGSASAPKKGGQRSTGTKQQRSGSANAAAAAVSPAGWGGLELQGETLAGVGVLLNFSWALVLAAQEQVRRAERDAVGTEGGLVAGSAGSGLAAEGLMRLAAGRSASGLTVTASEDGEVGLVARIDIRPAPGAAPRFTGAQAKPGSEGVSGDAATAGSAEGPAAGAATAAATPAGAAAAGSEAASVPEEEGDNGLAVRDLGSQGRSGRRFELLQSSSKLVSQVSRPHKFEVGLHLNLRKLMGDLPADAPDVLLPLQQPAGATVAAPPPSATAAPASAPAPVDAVSSSPHRPDAAGPSPSGPAKAR
ncbi:hypothetical protein GPECTOR_25g460 [Gonium pectorale]|uniref:Uncharacterized protein n=1 Tax=Gonium pectorale TaxID=33097 RepID=A0A150GGX0_GONPE|nr:hypothetical protein GPECTOR_25g460 [Gonium pectorale]|eukprot:KXZ48875.1 hypothetical protein GPECTOR_25g460 [Gonium pectorale]